MSTELKLPIPQLYFCCDPEEPVLHYTLPYGKLKCSLCGTVHRTGTDGSKATKEERMARKKQARLKVSRNKLSRKVAKIRREDPSLTIRQAVGKAAGILRPARKKKK